MGPALRCGKGLPPIAIHPDRRLNLQLKTAELIHRILQLILAQKRWSHLVSSSQFTERTAQRWRADSADPWACSVLRMSVHAVQDGSRSRRQLCMQRHCADSRVPPLGRARVPWGPRRVSSDEESVYNSSIIETMDWSIEDRRNCIDSWKSRINDAPGILRANGDVHMYILSKAIRFFCHSSESKDGGD